MQHKLHNMSAFSQKIWLCSMKNISNEGEGSYICRRMWCQAFSKYTGSLTIPVKQMLSSLFYRWENWCLRRSINLGGGRDLDTLNIGPMLCPVHMAFTNSFTDKDWALQSKIRHVSELNKGKGSKSHLIITVITLITDIHSAFTICRVFCWVLCIFHPHPSPVHHSPCPRNEGSEAWVLRYKDRKGQAQR